MLGPNEVFKMALGKFALAAKRSHPDKLAKTKPAHKHPRIALALLALLPHLVNAQTHDTVAAVIGHQVAEFKATGVADLVSALPPRFDQGQSGSCTAHSFVGALATRCKYAQQPPSFVASPKQVYSCTRGLERADTTPAGQQLPDLQDQGAELADVIRAAALFGVAPMADEVTPDGRVSDVWSEADVQGLAPMPDPNVNNEPDLAQVEQAESDPLAGAYTIDLTQGATAVQTACASLDAGYPLYNGFFCDSAFQQLQANDVAQVPNTSDQSGGGHAVFFVAHRDSEKVPGTKEFLLVNSWGVGWAAQGCVWVSQAFFLAMWECWVIDEKLVQGMKEAA